MSENRFRNFYRISSPRALWHDYSDGLYFVTICTLGREHYFGQIALENSENKMFSSPLGQYADEQLRNVATHYPYAEIPLFTVMPNHIHAVAMVNNKFVPYTKRDVAQSNNCGNTDVCRDVVHRVSTTDMKKIANMQGWLSVVIGGLKRAITHYAHELNIPFAWQRGFHDRIIRNQDELNRIALYIEQNVANWHTDKLNSTQTIIRPT